MSKLRDELRKKFKTPREAILALGLDESILTERAYDSANPLIKEKTMKKAKLSALGTVAYGALTTFLRPQLAMDSRLDLRRGLRNINARNFKSKRPVLAAWLAESVKGKLDPQFAQDGALDRSGLDAVLDMIEAMAEDEFPDDLPEKKKDDKKAEDEEKDDELGEDEDDDEKDEPESDDRKKGEKMDAKAKDKKAKDKKPMAGAKDKKGAKDKDVNEEDEDHDPETSEEMADDEDDEEANQAMDARIERAVEARVQQERQRMEAVTAAKEHVRPRIGSLSMAFDSAGDVYRHALKRVTGKEPPKKADAATLKYAFDNLPPKDSPGQRQTYAMDSAGGRGGSHAAVAARSPELAKKLALIGRA